MSFGNELVRTGFEPIALEEIPDFGHADICQEDAEFKHLRLRTIATGGILGAVTLAYGAIVFAAPGSYLLDHLALAAFVLPLCPVLIMGGAVIGNEFISNIVRLIRAQQCRASDAHVRARLAAAIRTGAASWNEALAALKTAIVGCDGCPDPSDVRRLEATADALAAQRKALDEAIRRLKALD